MPARPHMNDTRLQAHPVHNKAMKSKLLNSPKAKPELKQHKVIVQAHNYYLWLVSYVKLQLEVSLSTCS